MSDDGKTLERALRAGAPAASEADAAKAAARLSRRADDDGLVEVAYTTFDAPIGTMLVATTPRGLLRVGLPTETLDRVLERIAADISPLVLELPRRTDDARRELEQYFDGRRREFDLPLDWRLAHGGFTRRLLRHLDRVPYGEVITYSEAAKRAGSPRAHRAAGNALGSNPIPVVVPCHRVIRAGNILGNYGGGPELKRYLLEHEGWHD
jgi:methylated-DNA-[protein]-cysteine S-methyltransferase